jgi:hypothetical protein
LSGTIVAGIAGCAKAGTGAARRAASVNARIMRGVILVSPPIVLFIL